MSSNIIPSNVDSTYPVPGVNNSTQGLRQNFAAIQANFVSAENEINDLLDKVVVKSDLTYGRATNGVNDFNGMITANTVFKNTGLATVILGTTDGLGVVTVDVSQGAYQTLTLNASGTTQLTFANWRGSGTYSELTLRVIVSNIANILSLPSTPTYLFAELIDEFDAQSKQFTFLGTGIYEFKFSTIDGGDNISVIDTVRNTASAAISYSNSQGRSQQSKNSDVVSVLDFVISVKNNVIVSDGTGSLVPIGDGNSHPLSTYFATLSDAHQLYPCAVSLSDELAWVALQTALNSVSASYGTVYVPAGNYLCNRAVTLPVVTGGAHGLGLYGVGAGGSVLTFTGATDGVTCSGDQKYHVTVEKLSVISANSGGGSAIKLDAGNGGENAACNVSDVYVDASGAGNWAYNFWGRGYESSMIRNFHAHGGTVGIHLEGYSNATTIINVLLGAQATIGLEVDSAQPVTLFGGTIQGAASDALLKVINGGKVLVHGTYFENVVACPWIQANGSTLHLFNAHLGGGYSTDAIWGYNWSSIRVEGMTGSTNASGSIVRYDGGNFGIAHAHNTVINSQVSNNYNSGNITVTDELYVIGTDTADSHVNDVHWPVYAPYLISISSIKFANNTSLSYTSSTPTAGQYSVLDNGKIIFSSSDYGSTVKITYTRTAGHGVTFNGVTAPKAMHNLITLLSTGTSHGCIVLRSKAACVDNNYIKLGYPSNSGYAVYTDGIVYGTYTTGSTFTLNNNHFYFLTDLTYVCNKPYDSTQGNYDYTLGKIPATNNPLALSGLVGDGVTDNYATINAAIQAAGWSGAKDIYLGFDSNGLGKYYISQPLTFSHVDYGGSGNSAGHPGVQRFIMSPGTELIYNGTDAAVTITGYRGTSLLDESNQANFRLAVRKSSMAWDTTDATSVGVKIVDCNSCKFWIESTIGYNTGLLLTNSSGDCTDNDIWLGRLTQHKTYVKLLSAGGNGVNQNRFYGGVLVPVATTLTNVAITGAAGQFSCTAPNTTLYSGQYIVISGTKTGTGAISGYSNPTTYMISTTNGSTTFTLVKITDGSSLSTTTGTTTGWTFTPQAIKGTRQLWLSSGSCNTNIFYGTDIEGGLVEYSIDCAGSANSFENVRVESSRQINLTGSGNRFTGGYWSTGRLDLVSDTGANNTFSTSFTERRDIANSSWPSLEWMDSSLRKTGVVNTSGNTVTFVSGDNFPVGGYGLYQGMITIDGKPYEIDTNGTTSNTTITLTSAVATSANVTYTYDQRAAAFWPQSKRLSIGGAGFPPINSNFPDQIQASQINSGQKASISAGVMQGTRQPIISMGIDDSSSTSIGRLYVGANGSTPTKLYLGSALGGDTLTVTSAGLVGINTTSPAAKLDVQVSAGAGGNDLVARFGTTYSSNGYLELTANGKALQMRESVSGHFSLVTNATPGTFGTTMLFVQNDGNVGIGTTSPSTLLHVASASFGDITMEGAGSRLNVVRNNTAANTGIAFKDGATTKWSIDFLDSARDSLEGLSISRSGIGSALTNSLLYLSATSGNVGIGGVTNPTASLHVAGNFRMDGGVLYTDSPLTMQKSGSGTLTTIKTQGVNIGLNTNDSYIGYGVVAASSTYGLALLVDTYTALKATLRGVQIFTPAPSSAIGASGDVAGLVAFDSSYVYYCTAAYDGSTHIWKRSALSSY